MTDDTPREDPPFVVRTAGSELITGDDIFDTINNVAEPQPKLRRIMPQPADDVPPQVELPRLVDDCNSETYDAAKARLAYLEDWRVRQQQEIGRLLGRLDDRDQAITRVRAIHHEQAMVRRYNDCDCPDAETDGQHDERDTVTDDRLCGNSPLPSICASCEQDWPCQTERAITVALDGPTQE